MEAWLGSTNRRRRSPGLRPIAAGIREHGEISGTQPTGFRGNPLSWTGVAAGVEEGRRAPMTPYGVPRRAAPRRVSSPLRYVRVNVTRVRCCVRPCTCVCTSKYTCKGRTQDKRVGAHTRTAKGWFT